MDAQSPTKHLLYCLLACCINFTAIQGQGPSWVFENLGKNAGLLDDRHNTFIKKDSRDFVWISSEQGLFRFDGQQIQPFSINSSDGINYGEIIQSEIWEDQSDDFWFTTIFALHKFDRDQELFHSWQFSQEEVNIEKDYHAFYLEKEHNQLWLCTDQYLWRCDLSQMRPSTPFLKSKGIRFAVDTDAGGRVTRIIACPWWIHGGIEVWQEEGIDDWAVSFPSDPLLMESKVSGAVLNNGRVWLATMDNGLLAYDLEKDQLVGQYMPKAYQKFSLWNVQQFAPHILALASKEEGLWFFDTRHNTFTQNWRAGKEGLISSNNPIAIYVDSSQHLWVTQPNNGVDHLYSRNTPFQVTWEDSLGEKSTILNLLEDHQKRIWVLSKEQGILVFDQNGKLLHRYEQLSTHSSLSDNITQISIDSVGVIWALANSSIYTYDPGIQLAEQAWIKIDVEGASRPNSIFHGKNKKFLIATNGVFELQPTATAFQIARHASFDTFQHYQFDYFFGIDDHEILAPFNNHELWRFQQEEKTVRVLSKYKIAAETYDIFQKSTDSSIWIGTDKGLYTLKGEQLDLVLDHTTFGTSCNIYSIQQDSYGVLWLGTDKGLWQYNIKTKEVYRYLGTDGIPDEIFYPAAKLEVSDGKIWFGTESGAFFFETKNIELKSVPPKAHIENLWINNKMYAGDTIIGEEKAIQLQYFQNTLEFELRTIGYEQVEQAQIKYRLLGYDDDWTLIRNGNIARFTKLPPGNYVLEVLPISSHHHPGSIKRLDLGIPPPYWQTLWFKLTMGLLTVLLIGAIPAIYYRRKLLAEKRLVARQSALNEERNRIYRDLHDDLGGGLSSIIYISEDVLDEEENPERVDQLQRIVSLSQQAVKNMRDMIWALNSDKDTLEELGLKIKSDATQKLKDHHLSLQFNMSPVPDQPLVISGQKRRQILAIVTEALNNIAKHAKATSVQIDIDCTHKALIVQLQDNGQGFDTSEGHLHGYGLANMRHRAEKIGGILNLSSQIGEGSKIALIIDL